MPTDPNRVRRMILDSNVDPRGVWYQANLAQDLAFEKAAGVSPKERHHVRFWLVLAKGDSGEPLWLGSATFDRSVGVSRYTGQVTHHIAPDIDAERDLLAHDLVVWRSDEFDGHHVEPRRLRQGARDLADIDPVRRKLVVPTRLCRSDRGGRERFHHARSDEGRRRQRPLPLHRQRRELGSRQRRCPPVRPPPTCCPRS